MIYLGNKINTLNIYSKDAICWLTIKIKGRKTKSNSTGHSCGKSDCIYCNSNIKRRKSLNSDFADMFDDTIIETLIKGNPQELIKQNRILEQNFVNAGYSVSAFKTEAKKLFLISGFRGWFRNKDEYDLKEKWNYKLARLLDNHSCTYCNREYIFVYENSSGGKGMVPQFDHWYSKSDFPLLSISFYNLIPSCATCNSIKSKAKFNLTDHLHPYVDKDISNSFRFTYKMRVSHDPIISFVNNKTGNYKPSKTVLALNLPLIYKGHSFKELKDLYDLRFKYSDNYLDILLKKTFSKKLRISEQEKYRLIFGIELDDKNYHKRIFSKFKSDIIEKLLSIKK